MIGSSQYFLLCRMNNQNSFASASLLISYKDFLLWCRLKQPLELLARLSRILPFSPVALTVCAAPAKRVASNESRNDAVGREDTIEHQPQQDTAVNVAERHCQRHPKNMKTSRNTRESKTR